jgi:hypothetical protein
MPFTLSHAVAVLPLNKKPLVLSALIIGTFSPDFSYFIPLFANATFSHTIAGIFLFCMPISFIFLLFLHFVLRKTLILLIPTERYIKIDYLNREINLSMNKLFWIFVSIGIGAFTHIFWDSFTHQTGYAVINFPILSVPVIDIYNEPILLFKILQYFSSVGGGLIFLFWLIKCISGNESRNEMLEYISKHYIGRFSIIITISIIIGFFYGFQFLTIHGFKSFVVKTIIGTINSLCTFVILLSVFLNTRKFIKNKYEFKE